MEEVDLKLRMLLGKPINIGFCDLKPLTLSEIEEIGYTKYNRYLGTLCISAEDIRETLDLKEDDKIIEPFEYIYALSYQNEEYKNFVIEALKFFIKDTITFISDGYFIVGDINQGNILHKLNFNYFVDILKEQNVIKSVKKDDFVPKNEKEKEFYKKLKKTREKYAKACSVNDITDIISSVCSKHPSLNVFNIGDLTIYQLIDQYKRLNMIDEYSIGIESLLHGAKKEDVKLVHWASRPTD